MKNISVEELQQAIQIVDGKHSLGAGDLAEALLKHFNGLAAPSEGTYEELSRIDIEELIEEFVRMYGVVDHKHLTNYILEHTGELYVKKPSKNSGIVPERIVCSAIESPLGILLGVRHCDHYMLQQFEQYRTNILLVQGDNTPVIEMITGTNGFLTNKGRFLNRKEAYIIAKEQNQIVRPSMYDTNELFSENLY